MAAAAKKLSQRILLSQFSFCQWTVLILSHHKILCIIIMQLCIIIQVNCLWAQRGWEEFSIFILSKEELVTKMKKIMYQEKEHLAGWLFNYSGNVTHFILFLAKYFERNSVCSGGLNHVLMSQTYQYIFCCFLASSASHGVYATCGFQATFPALEQYRTLNILTKPFLHTSIHFFWTKYTAISDFLAQLHCSFAFHSVQILIQNCSNNWYKLVGTSVSFQYFSP